VGPKSPAYAAALIQHLIGWLTVIPFAAILRRLMVRWRWWVVPATVIYSIHPQLMYWEHVLIADSLFIALALLAVSAFSVSGASRRWELLAFTLSIVLLSMATRPVGRALWALHGASDAHSARSALAREVAAIRSRPRSLSDSLRRHPGESG